MPQPAKQVVPHGKKMKVFTQAPFSFTAVQPMSNRFAVLAGPDAVSPPVPIAANLGASPDNAPPDNAGRPAAPFDTTPPDNAGSPAGAAAVGNNDPAMEPLGECSTSWRC